jgi:flagellar protein FlaG
MGLDSITRVSSNQDYKNQTAPVKTTQVEASIKGADSTSDAAQPQYAVNNYSSVKPDDDNTSIDKVQEEPQAKMKDVKELNKIINNNTVAEFGYNEPTKRITIKIKDKDTGEVIKEIPSEKALKMLEKAWEIAGILVDEKR